MLAQLSFSMMTCYGRQEAHSHTQLSPRHSTTQEATTFTLKWGRSQSHSEGKVKFTSPTKSQKWSLSSFHLGFPSGSTASGNGEHILSQPLQCFISLCCRCDVDWAMHHRSTVTELCYSETFSPSIITVSKSISSNTNSWFKYITW